MDIRLVARPVGVLDVSHTLFAVPSALSLGA